MATLALSDDARSKLLSSTQANLARVYDAQAAPHDRAAIDELLSAQAWTELDDRFYRDIAFGMTYGFFRRVLARWRRGR